MILDQLENLETYKNLSPDIYEGLKYLRDVDPEIPIGSYRINERLVANVMEYNTVEEFKLGYEAHRKYADVQLALVGTELIRCKPLPQVTETIPYDEAKDAARYADCPGADLVIGEGYFLVVFPDDAHEPGLAVGGVPAPVKKVVMKVPVE